MTGNSKKPATVPVADGRARLRAAKFAPMEGGQNSRMEIWLDEHGCPHTFNYVGPTYGQDFLKKDLDDAIPLN